MTIGLLFALIALAGIAAAAAWTFVPGLRDRMKGWTTVIEAGGGLL